MSKILINLIALVGLVLVIIAGALLLFKENDSLKKTKLEEGSAIAKVIKLRESENAASYYKTKYGIIKLDPLDLEKYIKFAKRLEDNIILRQAVSNARAHDIYVFVSESFLVNSASIVINVNASDEEIINFLLGTPAEKSAGR